MNMEKLERFGIQPVEIPEIFIPAFLVILLP